MRFRTRSLRAVVVVIAIVALVGPSTQLAISRAGATEAAALGPGGPGGSVSWQPTGRKVLGRSVLYTGSYGGAFVAWMDPQLARAVVVPGTSDPLRTPWGGQVAPDQRPFLVASFNGGFKWGDFSGGVIALGASYRDPVLGQASFIAYDDGSYTVGQWGRDNDPAKRVVALRQNLGMLVDAGSPTATMRGAVGIDANGGLIWAGGRLSPLDLARALVGAGAVRGMELDINPDWVGFNSYDVSADNVAHGHGLFGATGADRYLHPDGRDFIAVFVRGTVVPGATARLGAAPLRGTERVR